MSKQFIAEECHSELQLNLTTRYWKFMRKRNKEKYVMKKIILKDSIIINYIEYKHKNTGTTVSEKILWES